MKNIIIIMAIAIATIGNASAQTFTPKASSGGAKFDVESGIATGTAIEVDGKSFDLYETAKGARYVKAVSKTGSTYPCWIGDATEHVYEGRTVYVYRSGTFAIYKLTAKGYPSPRYLDASN